MPMRPAPPPDGKGKSFANLAQEPELRSRVPNLDVTNMASSLLFNMDPVARDVRTAVGDEKLLGPDSAMGIPQVLRGPFAPGAINSFYREVVRFPHI